MTSENAVPTWPEGHRSRAFSLLTTSVGCVVRVDLSILASSVPQSTYHMTTKLLAGRCIGEPDNDFWFPAAGGPVAEDEIYGDYSAFSLGNRSDTWVHWAMRTAD